MTVDNLFFLFHPAALAILKTLIFLAFKTDSRLVLYIFKLQSTIHSPRSVFYVNHVPDVDNLYKKKGAVLFPPGRSSPSLFAALKCLILFLILNDYKDAVRRSAEGDGSPVASPPKAEVESGATMTAKPSARLCRGEIFLPI